MCVRDLYESIEGEDFDGIEEREWKKLNSKAVALVREFADDSVHQNVANYTYVFELWNKLGVCMTRKSTMSKVFMMRKPPS